LYRKHFLKFHAELTPGRSDAAVKTGGRSVHGLNHSFGACPVSSGITGPIQGMRNLLPLDNPGDAFGHGQTVQGLRDLMRKLAARVAREPDWPDRLPKAAANEDNPGIPSGYTYLLQLIAHDIVHTSISLAAADGRSFGFENARLQPLALETIFGGGPDVCPHAYAFSRVAADSQGSVPRTRQRVGRTQAGGTTAGQPFADLGRTTPVDVKDDGLPAGSRSLTEALVADPRNDDHALISQLTALLHRLHNLIIDQIEAGDAPVLLSAAAYRNFICARLVCTLIYRRIIIWDVLPRLLHPAVLRHYVIDRKPLVAQGDGVPMEFSQGAFRCGHAMVRSFYRVNNDDPQDPGRALQLSSQRSPDFLPVTDVWTVHWERFFELEAATTPNHSRRLGPSYSAAIRSEWFFPPLVPNTDGHGDAAGLPSRDFVSAVYADLWSVPALIERLRAEPDIAAFLPSYAGWRQALTEWLNAAPAPEDVGEPLSAGDVDALAADPPLPFFVLFEAACTRGSPASPFKGGGQHLGPLGSIIVAETIMGAIQGAPFVDCATFDPGTDLRNQIARACERLGVDQAKLASIPDIRSMPELLQFMQEHGALYPSDR
jgi:hypothetical protein